MYPDLAPGPLEKSSAKRRKFQKSKSNDISKRPQDTSGLGYNNRTKRISSAMIARRNVTQTEADSAIDASAEAYVEREIDTGFVLRDSTFKKPRRKRIVAQKKEPTNECEAALQNLLENEQLPDKEMQIKMADYIKTESAHAAITADYERAAQLHRSYQLLCSGVECQKVEECKNQHKETIEERLKATNEKLESERQKWEITLAEFYEQQREAREKLEQLHLEEADDFERKWGDEESLTKYRKPSPALLQLRKMQKSMALTHMYDDAKQVKEAADSLAGEETETAQERAVSAMKLHYDAMVEKHEREMSCFEEHSKREELYLMAERDSAIQPLEKLRDQLTNKINADQPMNLKPSQQLFTSTTRSRGLVTMPSKNPGTAHAVMQWRRSEGTEHLSVKGINVRMVMGKRRG